MLLPATDTLPVFDDIDIRRLTPSDMQYFERGVALIQWRYPGRPIENSRRWFEWLLKSEDRLVLSGSYTVGAAYFNWKYGFEPRAGLEFLASGRRAYAICESLRMVQMMVAWAKEKGAKGGFRLDADTGLNFDSLSRRLGGQEYTTKYWEIPLE